VPTLAETIADYFNSKIVPDERGRTGPMVTQTTTRKLFAACNAMHQLIPKCNLVKARIKPEMICGKTSRGANSRVSAVSAVNRKLKMWTSPKAKQLA